MKSLLQSRTGAVVAGAATLALLTGGIATANTGKGSDPNGRPFQDQPSTVAADTSKPIASIIEIPPGAKMSTQTECAPGTSALSGGYEVEGNGTVNETAGDISVLRDQPSGTYDETTQMFNAWQVEVFNGSSALVTLQVAVVCAAAS